LSAFTAVKTASVAFSMGIGVKAVPA
jgi:hypothetical protein